MKTLRFCAKLYRLEALEQAVRAYAGLAPVCVEQGEDYHVVSGFSQAGEPALADEFSNYALSLMRG